MVSLLHQLSLSRPYKLLIRYSTIKRDSDRSMLMQKDKQKIIRVADELDLHGYEDMAELELLMRAEALLKSVCKIAMTEDDANQECRWRHRFTRPDRLIHKSL
jgi:hypothetical protein